MQYLFSLTLLGIVLAGCATQEVTQANAPKSTTERIGDAVTSPLNDLNLMQASIPAVLTEAVKNPYLAPSDDSCQGLVDLVERLDVALGPDMDAIVTHDKDYLDKGEEYAQNEAVGTVERTVQGVIPFRAWIRRLSGAEKRSNELKAAVAAGVMRRAFLKGMGQERHCAPPAAPLPRPPAKDDPAAPANHADTPASVQVPD